MKKKSSSKSKDRDKNKNDESKSHKHSRRRRKSSSESDSEAGETRNDISDEVKTRRGAGSKKETENNVVVTRITRHSKRLAAISAGSDEIKDELTEISSPVKTGKLSPFSGECKGSPSKELKKKDGGTPDKHRPKDSEVWKVKSANGAGSGEIQKLKICRQRSPEPSTNIEVESNDVKVSEVEAEMPETNNVCENEIIHEQVVYPVNEEDIANIQLPSEYLQPPTAVEEIPIPEDSGPIQETITYSYPIGTNVIPEDVSQICLPVDEPKQNVQFIEEITPVPIYEPVEDKLEASVEQETPQILQTEEPVTESEQAQVVEREEPMIVEEPPQPEEPTIPEVSEPSPIAEIVEPEEHEEIEPQPDPLPVTDSPRVSEPEDNLQTEIVLTVEENVMEEAGDITEPEMSIETVSKKPTVQEKELDDESVNKIVEPQELEEVYDYEHDDTKEEGELSANECVSPIHEVFKRCPIGERTRSWGTCNVFYFNHTNVVASERILKEYNVKKRTVNKEELDASDSEDLIFVKEIREENIVHEIESETNNTSYVDKEDDDIIPVSPKRDDEKETKKKRLSDSDRRKSYSRDRIDEDRHAERSKRVSREGRSHGGEVSTVLYITNLVRPFTINQLRELLQRTGKIVEDGFWIDSIKSKCYVQFETEDEALETRHALNGIRWPVNNPKVLSVQFATQDALLSAQAQTHESEIPRKTEPLVVENHANDSRRGIDWKKHFEQYDERPVRKVKDVREWDIGKPAHPDDMIYAEPEDPRKNKEDLDKNRKLRKDRRRRDASDDETPARKQRKTANESGQPPTEAKLLDDLFRRTKASPSIYWLPLSDEQIAVKQETRRKHLEDIDKQMKKRENDNDRDRRRDRDTRHNRR